MLDYVILQKEINKNLIISFILLQASWREPDHHNWKRILSGSEAVGKTVSYFAHPCWWIALGAYCIAYVASCMVYSIQCWGREGGQRCCWMSWERSVRWWLPVNRSHIRTIPEPSQTFSWLCYPVLGFPFSLCGWLYSYCYSTGQCESSVCFHTSLLR